MMLSAEDNSEELLKTLNKYFWAAPFEKHPEAMMNFYLTEAYEKFVKTPKERIRQREADRIYNYLITKLRAKYGPWINLTDFRVKRGHLKFRTNFSLVYKTHKGLLYGQPTSSVYNRVFFTSHSLERFVERVNPKFFEFIKKARKKITGDDPCGSDILTFSMMGQFEYAKEKSLNLYYLNTGLGVLVFENFEDIFVAKTFLTSEMIDTLPYKLNWYEPVFEKGIPDYTKFKSLKEMLEYNNVPITPDFIDDYEDDTDDTKV